MAVPTKPNPNPIWASGGTSVDPGTTKRSTGWIKEIPPFEQFNWILFMLNQFVAHVNARGIPEWDSTTSYDAGALVMGSDTVVYRSLTNTNAGNDPVGDAINWKKAWTDSP